jgi:hypothetical protein
VPKTSPPLERPMPIPPVELLVIAVELLDPDLIPPLPPVVAVELPNLEPIPPADVELLETTIPPINAIPPLTAVELLLPMPPILSAREATTTWNRVSRRTVRWTGEDLT